jgi:hypothetical protein
MSVGRRVPVVDLDLHDIIPRNAVDRSHACAWVRYVRQYKFSIEIAHGEEVVISLAGLNRINASDADPDPPQLNETSDHAHLAATVLRHLDTVSVQLLAQLPPLPAIPIPLIQAELHPERAGDYVIRAVVADALQCTARVDDLVATVVRDRFEVTATHGGMHNGYAVARALRFLGISATRREVILMSNRLAMTALLARKSRYTIVQVHKKK